MHIEERIVQPTRQQQLQVKAKEEAVEEIRRTALDKEQRIFMDFINNAFRKRRVNCNTQKKTIS